MKNLIVIILFTATSLGATSQQYGWTDISANMPALGGFTDVHFIGNEGWITGGNDQVFYTPDGGNTFVIQSLPPQPGNFGITSSVFMKDNMEGYVVTYSGEINKTDDGGASWTTLHEPGGVLNSVHFPPNSDTGYACGGNGTIWSFDGLGITDISPSGFSTNLQSICFPVNNDDGKVCGQTTIARYKNESWSNLQFYDCTLNYNSITFVNDTTGWIGGIDGTIIHTSDGIHWLIQTSNTTKTIYDILFLNSLEGWAAGSEVLLHTIDGGTTWTQEIASQTVGKALMGVYFTSPNNGFVVGNNTVLKYGDVSGTGNTIAETIQLDIFPNPAVEVISLQSVAFNRQSAVVQIYDLNGRKRLEKHIAKGQETTEIDVSGLASGVYFCRLISEKYSATQKLIIQK